jgi:hypothetical protein
MSGKAEARLIYSTISTSERVSSLGVKGALLYTWLITHCDGQGRLLGKPKVIKAQIVPFLDEITLEDITLALERMGEQKLIISYTDDKKRPLIQVADWWDFQTGLRYKSASHYQAPDGWEDKITPRDEMGRFAEDKSTES